MCTDDQAFTTVVGPRRNVGRLVETFLETSVASRHRISSRPEFIDLSHLAWQFKEPYSPTVAVIRHDEGQSFAVAAELQTQVLVGDRELGVEPLPDLLCEPGYLVRSAAATTGPMVAIDPRARVDLQTSAPGVTPANGTRVAVLDTGLRNAKNQMVDFLSIPPALATSVDDHGHGTAVAGVISDVGPNADIHPLRVLGAAGTGFSYQVLAGLAYALLSDSFDIVNASLTSMTSSMCDHSFGSSISYIVESCIAQSSHPPPILVAAAGNDPNKTCGYPAVLPNAIVAMALERDPNSPTGFARATYNSVAPQSANKEEAFGGSQADPIGTLTLASGKREDLYGTSFAAAAITGAHVP